MVSGMHFFPLLSNGFCKCRILQIPTQELQHRFERELPESVKQPLSYARNFLEFCSYLALFQASRGPDYLSNNEFRRLSYDMMLAWEAPDAESEPLTKVRHHINCCPLIALRYMAVTYRKKSIFVICFLFFQHY